MTEQELKDSTSSIARFAVEIIDAKNAEIARLLDAGKYASMTPEERHAYCLNWVRKLNLRENEIVTVCPGIEVFCAPALMDKWSMIVDNRKGFRISESFGLDGIGDVYPVFCIIRAIERGELK